MELAKAYYRYSEVATAQIEMRARTPESGRARSARMLGVGTRLIDSLLHFRRVHRFADFNPHTRKRMGGGSRGRVSLNVGFGPDSDPISDQRSESDRSPRISWRSNNLNSISPVRRPTGEFARWAHEAIRLATMTPDSQPSR